MRHLLAAASLVMLLGSHAAGQQNSEAEPPSMLGGISRSAAPLGSALPVARDDTRIQAASPPPPPMPTAAEPHVDDDDRDGLVQLIEQPSAVQGPPATSAAVRGAASPLGTTIPPKAGSDRIAAKTLFGAAAAPAPLAARAIGFYSRGCLAGAVPVPIDGDQWQVMRLSRNRNWGHPQLVKMVQGLARDAARHDGWPGLLVGDLSQPRGGPMLTGHNSHQIGLDADIWLTPMPDRRLSAKEREDLAATSMLAKDGIHADPAVFSAKHKALIRRAASHPQVERVLIHPGIKKAMCEESGVDRRHFHKIRPYWGHHYHMHIRIACPPDSAGCREQAATSGDDGCGREVDEWIDLLKRPPKPERSDKPKTPPKIVTVDDLPGECRTVLTIANPDAPSGPPVKAARSAR